LAGERMIAAAAARLSVDYTATVPEDESVIGVAPLPMPQLGAQVLHEVWRGDAVFGAYSTEDDDDIESAARNGYNEILRRTANEGHPHLLRIWNHVRDVNHGEGDEERYRRLWAGRHDAFAAAGWGKDRLPAASAIGIREHRLVIYYLASARPGTHFENPRQVSAYDYPRQYGRRSPSFARATVFGGRVFIAGTSSIVGHESMHRGDVHAQLRETLANIDLIAKSAGSSLGDLTHLKLYLRNASDIAIADALREAMPHASLLVLQADICRQELLLEIEAVGLTASSCQRL